MPAARASELAGALTSGTVREHHDLVAASAIRVPPDIAMCGTNTVTRALWSRSARRDLQGRGHLAAGRMQDDVERPVGPGPGGSRGSPPRNVEVDVAHHREAEQPHRLLPVHQVMTWLPRLA